MHDDPDNVLMVRFMSLGPFVLLRGTLVGLPLAHGGHWSTAVLYLAPVVIVVGALWAMERREKARGRRDDPQ